MNYEPVTARISGEAYADLLLMMAEELEDHAETLRIKARDVDEARHPDDAYGAKNVALILEQADEKEAQAEVLREGRPTLHEVFGREVRINLRKFFFKALRGNLSAHDLTAIQMEEPRKAWEQ